MVTSFCTIILLSTHGPLGDCEDGGKIIIRIYLGLVRLHRKTSDQALQKVISFLKCYYPFLVLLGVSSAQINAAPKDIVKMGAHENAMLTPLKQFMDELLRSNPSAARWRDEMFAKDPENKEFYERSAKYPDLVLEGTGVLEPGMQKEPSMEARLTLQNIMEEDVFYTLRRSYYYDQNNTSFYKTVEKVFCPIPIMEGGSFGSFLIMHRDKTVSDRLSMRKRLTKSASFSEFIMDSKEVVILIEPELTEAEKLAVFEGLKDIHPPVPLDAPSSPPAPKQAACEKIIADFAKKARDLIKTFGVRYKGPITEQAYYWRSGKIDPKTSRQVLRFLTDMPTGMLVDFEIQTEWITDEVGGYRLLLSLNSQVVNEQWTRLHKKTSSS